MVSSLPLKCTLDLPFPLLFKSALSKALDPRQTGISSNFVPFSIRFVFVSSVTLLFWSRSEKRPMHQREFSSIIEYNLQQKNSQCNFLGSPVFPIHCRYTLTWRWSFHGSAQVHTSIQQSSFWISARIPNVVNPGKIVHSNSIGPPSILWKERCWPKGQTPPLAEVHRGSCSGNIHMEEEKVEVKVQEDEAEDGKDKWRVRREVRREIKHTSAWVMDEMTRTNTWANVVWQIITHARKHEKKVTCEVYCLHTPFCCSRLPSAVNDPATTK